MRLKQGEWPAPIVAHLEIRDWDSQHNNFRRHIRVANLYTVVGLTKRTAASIFDPELLLTAAGGILLRGTEIEVIDKRVHEFVQMWLCRPTISEGTPLEPFDGAIPAFGQP